MKQKDIKVAKSKPSGEDLYKRIENQAWNWYNKEIAYNYVRTGGAELVLLRGHYEGKQAVKIPAQFDNLAYKKNIEELHGISIRKRIFDCSFDSVGSPGEFHTYLFMYLEPQV